MKSIILIALTLLTLGLVGQEKSLPAFRLSQTALVSSGTDLPFWMRANQNSVFTMQNNTYLLFKAGLNRGLERDSLKKWGYTYGANMVHGYAGKSDFHANEYWLGLRFHKMLLKAGAQSDPLIYGGLSSTNGNMYRSRNVCPVPSLSFL